MSTTKLAADAFVDFLKKDDKNDQYARFEVEADVEKIVQSLRLVAQLFPDQALMLCNRSHPKLQYVSANCKEILEYSAQDFYMLTVFDFLKLVHPEDLKGLQQCFDFINAAEPYDPETHRFVLYYRFKSRSGKYIHLRDEKLAIKNESQKYIYFTLFKNISQHEKFFHVKLDIHQQSRGTLLKVYSYNPRQLGNVITPRQIDIVKLIIHGFSNQEIADQLNLSVNTVKNHKQLLFRKANVKSSIELASYARGVVTFEGTESATLV